MHAPSCDGQTGSAEQRSRIAVLVLHGVGQQAKFETLASFAAGFADSASAGVQQVRRTPILIGNNIDSAITVSLDRIDVDFIEHYYQPCMQRQVGMDDVTRWLVETSFHIRQLYKDYNFESKELRKRREGRPHADGDFINLHYMLRQKGRWIAPFFTYFLDFLLHLSNSDIVKKLPLSWIVTTPLNWLITQRIDPLLREVAGDLIIYTTLDPKLALSSVRHQVLNGCVERLAALIRCEHKGHPRYSKVFVAGHSLGSVVAYDAVSRIALNTDHAAATGNRAEPALTAEEAERMGGMITFGSPLDKIALMFWPRGAGDDRTGNRRDKFYGSLLAHFHGLRGVSEALRLPTEVAQPEDGTFKELPWLNVYHSQDIIAGHLDAFRGVTNHKLDMAVEGFSAARRTAIAHGSYWSDPFIYNWLLDEMEKSGHGGEPQPQLGPAPAPAQARAEAPGGPPRGNSIGAVACPLGMRADNHPAHAGRAACVRPDDASSALDVLGSGPICPSAERERLTEWASIQTISSRG